MLKEKILKLLESKGIFLFTEQSQRRYAAEQTVVSLSIQIIAHVLKCLIYGPKCIALNHWYDEISSWIFDISLITLKPDDKNIPPDTLLKWGTQPLCIQNQFNIDRFNKLIRLATKKKEYTYTPGLKLVESSYSEIFELIKKIYINSNNNENYIEDACNEWFKKYKDVYKQD